jgi:hypothetical protein
MMLTRFVLAILIAALPALALAHGADPGPHGGEVEDANPGPALHIEVVLKGSAISVYLADEDGKQVPTAGVTGTATVLVNKKKEQVTLAPAGNNLLTGTGSFTPATDLRMLVAVIVSGTKQQALFSRLVP